MNKDSIETPAPAGWTNETSNFNYELSTEDIELKYSVSRAADGSYVDNLHDPSTKILGGFQAVNESTNFASDGTGSFIHGNNQIAVMVAGQDVSDAFATRRCNRVWTSPLTSNKPESSNTSAGPFTGGLVGGHG